MQLEWSDNRDGEQQLAVPLLVLFIIRTAGEPSFGPVQFRWSLLLQRESYKANDYRSQTSDYTKMAYLENTYLFLEQDQLERFSFDGQKKFGLIFDRGLIMACP